MRRTILTCLQSFQPAVAEGKKILLVPEFQEVGAIPCTIGSSKKKLEREFGSKVDLSLVQEGWNDKSEESPFNDYDRKKLAARAQKARQFLYDLSQSADDNAHIVVVTHEVMARPPKGKSFTQILKGLRFISPQGPEHTVEQPEGAVDYEAALEETDGSRNLRGVVLMQPNEYWRYKSSDDITTEG
ncbi:putative phosphoglycerate mutase family protein [Eutypa lata UCREL1]|uniref:Putative phosphoglycerate mutase family protein n=1 Tax=Eutypa lata (strain UCR-EL1) TaxID=1287681 RepID=M7TMF8_EUTLA|nr:putative phosphoglycerate mutase family protein [Eutypa lata UCREL1]